jgi:hypothetical protein
MNCLKAAAREKIIEQIEQNRWGLHRPSANDNIDGRRLHGWDKFRKTGNMI